MALPGVPVYCPVRFLARFTLSATWMILLVVEAVVAVAERTMVQVVLKGPVDQADRISFG